jgi:carbamoylphosphate synthase large subunit
MNGAANGSEAGFQSFLNSLSDLMSRNQVIDIHNHVHINEHLLTQNSPTGDVMAIKNTRYP